MGEPRTGLPTLTSHLWRRETRNMTAELLVATQARPRTPAAVDLSEQFAAAAVGHPGSRPCHVWPVDHGVEIRASSRHRAQMAGIGGQTVRIAAGAAVLNVRLAIAALGYRAVLTLLPAPSRSPVLAVLWRGLQVEATPVERALISAVLPTGRFLPAVGEGPVPASILHRVRRAAEAEGVWLRSVEGSERAALAERLPSIGVLAPDARVVAVGSNHDVPVAHLRAGLAMQRIVLTTRLLGATAAIVAWPADLVAAAPLPPVLGARGLCPQVLIAVGRPMPVAWEPPV